MKTENVNNSIIVSKEDINLIEAFMGYTEELCNPIDWNDIMPVVEKIEELGYSVEIFKSASFREPDKIWHRCIIERMENWNVSGLDLVTKKREEKICYIKTDSKIVSTYKAVVEFIKWHNSIN